ncbi:hypothetical protein ZOSMA_4G01540 [Zostera marina]|uniref:Endonuclease/exonuclease/phosphatase domain-containing protein n=1 Tax=Zostera marina TaxID=29655 RepID=A0A0K9P0W6_ZOSMR|nr:hypothetical protein ZOSMA_4G01540 [Zostera marina]
MRYYSPPLRLFFYSNLSMSNNRGQGRLPQRFSSRSSSYSTERRFGNQDQTIGYRQDPGFYGTQQPPPHFRPRSSLAYGFRPPRSDYVNTSQPQHFDNPQFHVPSLNPYPSPQFHAHSQNSHFVNRPPPQFDLHSQNGYLSPRFLARSQNSNFVNRPPFHFPVPPPLKSSNVRRFPPQFHFQPSPHRAHYHNQPPSSSAPSFNRLIPDDYRIWVPSKSQPSPYCEHFRLVSYNILADYCAINHQPELYFHISPEDLDWEWRRHNILSELQFWSPDILCLQEVDKFQDFVDSLSLQGYDGIWQMRTGSATDGCAIFWRTNRFQLRFEKNIEFKKYGLRDNVAQICVLESWAQRHVDLNSTGSSESHNKPQEHNRIVVCNIHVLYNPKRGEIKLGQVRILLDEAYSISREWNAPVVLCGDFNSTPKSPLYNFLSDQMLNLYGLDRNQISGQYSACSQEPPKRYNKYSIPRGDSVYAKKLQKRLENISLRSKEENHEVSVRLKMKVVHQEVKNNDLHTKSVSDDHREIKLLKHHVKDHDEINKIPDSSESIENRQHVSESITENISSVIISEKYSVEVLKETADEDILSQNSEDKLSKTFLNLDSCMDSTVDKESALLSSTVTDKPNDMDSEENPINSAFSEFQPAEKSSVKLELDLSESIHKESEINQDSFQDNPDPNFLAELHGPEENQIIDSNFQYHASFHSGFQKRNNFNPYAFTPSEIELASGNAECSFLQHNLKLKSVYTEVEDCGGTRDSNGEPQVTSYNSKFMGTVDYIWFSEGIQTTKVLDTIRRDVLQRTPGFPTEKWGSDHLALACELAFT